VAGAIARYIRSFTGFSRDARIFLLTTVVFGAAISLYFIDFNLYLESIGLKWTIGWLLAAYSLAGVLTALPASALSDRFGRRSVMAAGMVLVAVALLAFLPGQLPLLFVGVAALGAGSMAVSVVQIPFIAEHTRPDQRNEYFAIWSAIGFLTGLVAALAGGALAPEIASRLNLGSAAAPYQILLSGVAILGVLSLGTVWLLTSDRPAAGRAPAAGASRFGIVILDKRLFFRLLLPGFLTSLGAGQLIPFLNVFIENKFGLGLTEVNVIFAVTSLGTAAAILAQPALASRFGRIGSIVLVQGASIPFLPGRAQLADERGQPDLRRVRDGARLPGGASHAGSRNDDAVVARVGDRVAVLRRSPGVARIHRRLRSGLRHHHRAVHDRHGPALDLVPRDRPSGRRGRGRGGDAGGYHGGFGKPLPRREGLELGAGGGRR
jgi:MFS family permease